MQNSEKTSGLDRVQLAVIRLEINLPTMRDLHDIHSLGGVVNPINSAVIALSNSITLLSRKLLATHRSGV